MSEEERLVGAAAARGDEDETDRSLRPRQLDEFVGQEVVREQLSIALAAARERGEPIDHVLLAGPPGLGKSTLAHIVAREMDTRLVTVSGPGLDRKGDLVAILADLAERDVVFIDEVHRLNRSVEETLYPAMEDGVVDIIMGQGPGARSLRLDLAPFTLIGATTRASLLTKPLRDRFGLVFRLDHYSPAELVRIAQRSAGILAITDATIARMPAAAFREIIHTFPDVAEQLLLQLVARIRTLDQRVNEFSSMHVKNRIYAELLRRSRPDPTDQRRAIVSPPPVHSDIAARVSTRREMVARELKALERAGLMTKRRGAFVLNNVPELMNMLQKD